MRNQTLMSGSVAIVGASLMRTVMQVFQKTAGSNLELAPETSGLATMHRGGQRVTSIMQAPRSGTHQSDPV